MPGEQKPVDAECIGALRRTPSQARAWEKVARVLDAADRVLAENGAAALTTTRVAAEAGISVGGLYRYLPDRDAIIDALAERYLGRLEVLMDELVDWAAREAWPDPVALLVDTFAGFYRAEPGFCAMWFGRDLTLRTRDADRRHKLVMAAGLRRILVAQGLLPDNNATASACFTALLAADAVTQEAFRVDVGERTGLLRQLKIMLRAYLDRQMVLSRRWSAAGAAVRG